MPFSGCWLQINSLSNFVAEVYRIMPFGVFFIFPCVSSNNIYSDKSTLKDVKMKYIIRIHKQAICFLQNVPFYTNNTLIDKYIIIGTGMLCNKNMNMKKVGNT